MSTRLDKIDRAINRRRSKAIRLFKEMAGHVLSGHMSRGSVPRLEGMWYIRMFSPPCVHCESLQYWGRKGDLTKKQIRECQAIGALLFAEILQTY